MTGPNGIYHTPNAVHASQPTDSAPPAPASQTPGGVSGSGAPKAQAAAQAPFAAALGEATGKRSPNARFRSIVKKIMPLLPREGEKGMNPDYWSEALDPRHRAGLFINAARNLWIAEEENKKFSLYEFMDKNPHREIALDRWGTWTIHNMPQVKYLKGPAAIDQYRVVVGKDGLWTDKSGAPVDTRNFTGKANFRGSAAFVIQRNGEIYIHEHVAGEMHHSTTTGGSPVLSAGMIQVRNGVPMAVSLNTGHYQSTAMQLDKFLETLKEKTGKIDILIDTDTSVDPSELEKVLEKYGIDVSENEIRLAVTKITSPEFIRTLPSALRKDFANHIRHPDALLAIAKLHIESEHKARLTSRARRIGNLPKAERTTELHRILDAVIRLPERLRHEPLTALAYLIQFLPAAERTVAFHRLFDSATGLPEKLRHKLRTTLKSQIEFLPAAEQAAAFDSGLVRALQNQFEVD